MVALLHPKAGKDPPYFLIDALDRFDGYVGLIARDDIHPFAFNVNREAPRKLVKLDPVIKVESHSQCIESRTEIGGARRDLNAKQGQNGTPLLHYVHRSCKYASRIPHSLNRTAPITRPDIYRANGIL
jgi:hypothetical protein